MLGWTTNLSFLGVAVRVCLLTANARAAQIDFEPAR